MEILAIIPARGGSKGIPRKNVQLLGGKPLIAWSIEAALKAPSVGRVVVSTDDAEIGDVSHKYGAEVVWRPANISGDEATSESALEHVLKTLAERDSYRPDLVVFLQATSPLRASGDVQGAINTMLDSGVDSLFSGCPIEGFIWARYLDDAVRPINFDPNHRLRRQDRIGTHWEENGSIYVFYPWVLEQYSRRIAGHVAVYPMGRLNSYQVDEPADLELMERLLRGRSNTELLHA